MPETSCSGWIDNLIDSIRTCLGFGKSGSSLIVENGEPHNGNGNGSQTIHESLMNSSFLSSSTCGDMEYSFLRGNRNKVQSLTTILSASLINQDGEEESSNNPDEFVNQGLLQWNRSRMEWLQNENRCSINSREHETRISWNATYENLLGTNRPFSRPIPLPEMVDFLVDVWEQEGLYDF